MEKKDNKILCLLIEDLGSIRSLARNLNEDCADVSRWLHGQRKIHPRAVVKICRLFGHDPHELREDIFPKDLKFIFKD